MDSRYSLQYENNFNTKGIMMQHQDSETHLFRGSLSNPIYTTHHSLPRNKQKTIRDELEQLTLPIDIINTADKIYKQMNAGTRRNQKRKQMIFQCVRDAYDQHNIPRDPKELADICGISYSGITKASSICSPGQTYRSPVIVYTPMQYIPDTFRRLDECLNEQLQFPDDILENITQIADEVVNADPLLLDEKPQIVAASIVLYYLETHGVKIDRKKYAKIFKSSDMTINKLKKQVDAAYNS